jgi:uncharacterized protein (DUF58 family)
MATTQHKLTDLLDRQFIARLDAMDVLSRKILQGKMQGERRSKRRGQSVEFASHRPYSVGDDLRFIDWNIYARLEHLFLKLFLEEQDLTVQILVDVSASTSQGEPPKGRFMRQLAAALGYVALANNNRLTLSAFADGIVDQLANVRGRAHVQRVAELLLTTPSAGPSGLEQACRQLAGSRAGSGLLIVISDLLLKEGYEQGLRRLAGPGYDLYVIQVLSPQELEPPMTGDLRLVDVEDDDEAEVTVSNELLRYYKKALAAYCNEIRDFCTRRGGQYMLADSSQSVEKIVLTHLRRRGLLG